MACDSIINPSFKQLNKDEAISKKKFLELDLKSYVQIIYERAIQKAEKNFWNEIMEERNKIVESSYTKEQQTQRISMLAEDVRRSYERDNCLYRKIKENILDEDQHLGSQKQRQKLIERISQAISDNKKSYYDKLFFLENQLEEEIYNSKKIELQFEQFKIQIKNSQKKIKEEKNAFENAREILKFC